MNAATAYATQRDGRATEALVLQHAELDRKSVV